ncbi:zinc finger protein 292b [Trichomycterus rosablanca]|uniref:zinc finger protein 292b n=1 Tax=Trichomycterus rosablanca TaxID=2290929 RepID=UPI002F35BAC6
MADGDEAEQDQRALSRSQSALQLLCSRLEELRSALRDGAEPQQHEERTAQYCRAFCQSLVECVSVWRTEEDPWAVLESYRLALLSFAQASVHLWPGSENVSVVLERLSLSCVEVLLSVADSSPDVLWEQFHSSVQAAHEQLQQNGVSQLRLLYAASQEKGMWSNTTLQSILRNETPPEEKVREFLEREGPDLLQLRVKFLIKENRMEKAALLAKACADFPAFEGSGTHFKQSYLVCLCSFAPQETLLDELSKVDCRDALEMICNLEADGDERGAFTLCSGFLTRQLLQEDSYCAWELTLFWSKLLKRLESSEQSFLERCQKMSVLAKTVVHLLFFIKVIQSELDKTGLPTCIEMCIRALRMESCEGANKTTICKTISCLLPSDLEIKRACQLTEFLLEPTLESYYAVETLYNEPDQKLEEENLPIPNSLRCDVLLVFKTQWPFDPEFWDWKTLKRHCLGLMGEEASIVCSIDELNDDPLAGMDLEESGSAHEEFKDVFEYFLDTTNELNEISDQKQKNREVKKLREKGFVSARFRNWQAYMQYCVLCDKEFLGHRIVRHAQTHLKDGRYSCPICTETFETRETLEPHVALHVKQSCKERLASMKTFKQLASAKTDVPVTAKSGENPAKTKAKTGYGGGLNNKGVLGSQSGVGVNGNEGNICPVPNCRKGFKYFRNLIAHVKDHGEVEEAKRFLEMQSTKIVCQYCRRHFLNVNHLNDHLQVHCDAKPYTCIQLNCRASFDTNAELLVHSKEHPVFKAKCMFPGCGKVFSEAYRLYDHEAQHYKTFTCKVPGCGKVFHTQSQLDLHEESHNAKPEEPQTTKEGHTHDSDPQPDHFRPSIKHEIEEDILPGPSVGNFETMPTDHLLGLMKVKHSVKNMLNAGSLDPTHAFDPGTPSTEPPGPSLTLQRNLQMDSQPIEPSANPMYSPANPIHPPPSPIHPHPANPMHSPANSIHPSASSIHPHPANPMHSPANFIYPPASPIHPSVNLSHPSANPSHPSANPMQSPTNLMHHSANLIHPPANPIHTPTKLNHSHVNPIHPSANPMHRLTNPMHHPANPMHPPANPMQSPASPLHPPANPILHPPVSPLHPPISPHHPPANPILPPANPIHHPASLIHPPANPLQSSINRPMPHLNEPKQEDSLLDVLMSDPMLSPPCLVPPAPSYQSILEDLQPVPSGDVLQAQMQTAVAQGHTQPLYNNETSAYGQYDSNPMSQIQAPYQVQYSNNVVPVTHTAHNVAPVLPVSQRLPPQVTPFPVNRQVSESRPVQPVQSNTGPVAEEKERYKCAYETCSRDYSNYRSLTKHMKAAHCDFYTQWKLAKRNNKVPPITSRPVSMNGNSQSVAPFHNQVAQSIQTPATQMQNPTDQHQYSVSCPNPNSTYHAMPSHIGASTSQPFPNQMENILDPIVLSQLGSSTNQSHETPHRTWNTVLMNDSLQQAYHSQARNMDVMSSAHSSILMNTATQGQEPNTRHEGMAYSALQHQNNPPGQYIQTQTDTQPIGNPARTGHTGDSSAGSYIQQPESNSVPVVKHTECIIKLERNPSLDSPPLPQNASPTVVNSQKTKDDSGRSTQDGEVKKRKRSNRTKWPAIIRDGKFICCRCFREFQSPKSLGGHLSKRAICKPYDETVLSADLPTSFLDLLNSPHLTNSPQSSPSHMDSNQAWPSVSKGPLDPKLFPNVTFLHTNDSEYANNNNKQSSETRKQGEANPIESVGVIQQTFAESSVSYPQDGQSSVIQHTGNIKEKNNQINQVHYTQPQPGKPSVNESAPEDSLLSCLLDEDRSHTFNEVPTDHVGRILQAKTLNKIKEIQEKSTITNTTGLSNDGLLAAMASLAQNLVSEKSVKEKLREQILAGDFHKRNTSGQGQGFENVHLQSSAASSPVMNIPQQTLNVIQMTPQRNEPPGNSAGRSSEHDVHRVGVAPDNTSPEMFLAGGSNDSATHENLTNPQIQQEDEITAIQRALERLDLDKEISEDEQSTTDLTENPGASRTLDSNSVLGNRGYGCDIDKCGYRAMTKDALFKHLIRQHNYTDDMLNQFRKEQFNLAPFTCQLCPKTFTRNSNLRTHYQTNHNYSMEQIVRMGITRPYNRKTLEGDQSPCPTDSLVRKEISTGVPVKSEYNHHFEQQPPASYFGSSMDTLQRSEAAPPQSQTAMQPSVIRHVPSAIPTPDMVQDGPRLSVPGQPTYAMPTGRALPTGAPLMAQNQSFTVQMGNLLAEKPKLGRPKLQKPREMIKKPKEKKMGVDDVFSPYRPYRCVHQGCVAAFTIQHNLILHYKAVHQSALPKFDANDDEEHIEEEEIENNEEEDLPEGEVTEVTELRCQVKDCSRIFQVVTDLLQHYLQLHKLKIHKAGAMMSGLNLGRFQCDQPNCEVTFTAIWKYISHVDNDHKEKKVSKVQPIDGVFHCEVEGCNLGYSTRSNLLRHVMKKHDELYKLELLNAKRSANGVRLGRPPKNYTFLEKENREVNKKPVPKPVQKGAEKKKKEQKNHWTKYGKPILKSQEEASAMCTKKFPLQYPCMIKGCETVTGSERNLMKHYVQHGLPKQDLEEQRSNYIFCKKMPRSKYKHLASKSDDSDESSFEVSENEDAVDSAPSESELSKPTSEKESTEDTEVSDGKLFTDVSSDSSVVVKRKKGRPRKGERVREKPVVRKRTTRLSAIQSFSENFTDNSDTSSSATLTQHQPPEQDPVLTSFTPMGFEMSFLKFLEESRKSPEKRKAPEKVDVVPRKKILPVQLKTATVVCSRINPDKHTRGTVKYVEFKNPQKLTSLRNVTFEVQRSLSNVFEHLLKQLHDMRPAVVIKKESVINIKG